MDESINFVVAQYVTVLNCPQLTFKALYILTDNKDPVVMILSVNVVTIKGVTKLLSYLSISTYTPSDASKIK